VENLGQLLELYRNDKRRQRLSEALEASRTPNIQLEGLMGAQEAFVLFGSYLATPRSFIYIADDKEAAAYFQNALEGMVEKKTIHFFYSKK